MTKTPPLLPPNGRMVTNGELYQALFQMDQRLGERDTALLTLIGGVRTDFSIHTQDGHPWNQAAEVTQAKAQVDMRKMGVIGALLGLGSACIAFVLDIFRNRLGI